MAYTIDVHLSADDVRQPDAGRRPRGTAGRPQVDTAGLVLRRTGQPAVRGDHPAPRVLPDPGRTRRLLEAHAATIAELSKADTLVELGAGSCDKTRVLLSALQEIGTLARYVPFDVSDEFLRDAASTLADEYDALDVHLVIGDFHQHLAEIPTDGRRMVAFLGGTIGNLNRRNGPDSCSISTAPCRATTHSSSVPIWSRTVDGSWRPTTTRAGVTADFNRNVLHVLNEQLGGNFDPELFSHVALWNEDEQWIEMRLRAEEAIDVTLADAGISVRFDEGEDLLTEISAKFTPERVERSFGCRLRGGRHVGRRRRGVPPDPGPPLLLSGPLAAGAQPGSAPSAHALGHTALRPPAPDRPGRRARGRGRRRRTSHAASSARSRTRSRPRLSTLATSRCGGR